MAETLYRCHMANTNGTSDKVWGAVVLKLTSGPDEGFYQYGSAWGRHGGFISKKLQKPEFQNFAIERYSKAAREKVAEGYKTVPHNYDVNLKYVLDNIYLDSTVVDQTNEKKAFDQAVTTLKEKIAKPKSSIPLPDLLCTASTCRHWLNVHATPDMTTNGYRFCLVSTCQCEQYRRTCAECGRSSVNAWTHMRDCITGLKELATSKDKPTTNPPTIYVRQPRRIMHLISDDD